MKKPCNDCPFRPRTFTPLRTEDVDSMLAENTRTAFFMYCHKDLVRQRLECRGSVLFRRGEQGGDVFPSERSLERAHARSRRVPVFHWDRDEVPEPT